MKKTVRINGGSEICRSVADVSLTDSVFSDHLPPVDEA